MEWVVDLGGPQDSPYALDDVGGKARNLAILLAAGLPVPPARCLTTAAYRHGVGTAVAPLLEELAAVRPVGTATAGATEATADLHRLAAQVRSVIEDLTLPDDLQAAIGSAYRALGSGPVAVRSSATAEDLAEASFAGQHDTFLQVVGEQAVVDAVRACWASLWSDRVVSYRADHGIDPRGVALAVVLQQMVDARTAGVMFTADPVSGTRGRCVIDAARGLGESVVSGSVDPDHVVLDQRTGAVLDRRVGAKSTAVVALPSGGVATVHRDTQGTGAARSVGSVGSDHGEDWALNDADLAALAALGRQVEDLYRAPQDTEWAIDRDGRAWLTQSRPITTLFPLVTRPDRGDTRVFFCASLAQGLTRPITPLGLAAFRLIGSSVATVVGLPPGDPEAGPPALQVAAGRLFVDATAALGHPVGRRLILAALGVMEARSAAVLTGLVRDGTLAAATGSPLALVGPFARLIAATRLPLRFATALIAPSYAHRAVAAGQQRVRRELRLPADAPAGARLDLVTRHLGSRTFLAMPTTAPYAGAGFVALAVARRLLRGVARPGELQQILRGLPHNPTTEMDLELWSLARSVGGDPDARRILQQRSDGELTARWREHRLPAVLEDGLTRFLTAYGHRAVAEIDLGMPRWADDPAHLFGVLRNYLRDPSTDGRRSADPQTDEGASTPADAIAQFRGVAAEAEAVRASLVARCRAFGPGGRLRARLVDWSLGRARQLTGLRESPKFLLVLTLALLREHLLQVADQLVADGRLAHRDDVAFVELADLRRGLAGDDLRAVVAERRMSYERELRRRQIPRIVLSDGTEPEALGNRDLPPGALRGSPASKGVVVARARVVLDPHAAHLEPGEVLVAPSTDPGWTPLFLTAGALVMEMGGSNSHGAVVAREYGIPAVVGVPDATGRISSGALVRVDGAAGTVEILTEDAAAAVGAETGEEPRTAHSLLDAGGGGRPAVADAGPLADAGADAAVGPAPR